MRPSTEISHVICNALLQIHGSMKMWERNGIVTWKLGKNSQSVLWLRHIFQTDGEIYHFDNISLQTAEGADREFNSMTQKKRLAQIVKHIIAQSQCELFASFGELTSSVSSASAGLQPGHELLGCLILQVGAHVAGVGAICVASK